MSAAYGKCDLCGRFAGSKGIESYDDWQPDYWNGPRTTFRCPECEARREPAAGTIIAEMRLDEDRATVDAIRDRAARRDNPHTKETT